MAMSPETKAKIEERWPSYAWLLNIEEVANLLSQAVEQEWAPDLFGSKLKATNWWRSRTETARKFADVEATDVATSHQMVNAMKVKIKEWGASIGVTIDDATAGSMAWDTQRQGMSDGEVRQFIASKFKPAGAPAINVRTMANKWMVSLSDTQVDDLTRRMFTGELDQAGLTAFMQTQATSQFPHLGDMIAKGITLGDFFDPYKQMIADMTDATPDSIDLKTDPVWSRVISTPDEKTGQIRPMSLNEAQKYIRGTDQFGNSRRGQAEAASFVTDFAQQLGLKR